ncbi:hypothetical protein [Methylocystis sp. S23]
MRFNSGLRAAAFAGALALLPGAALAQAGGFGGGHGGGHGGGGFGGHGGFRGLPAVGVGAYARGQGPTGAAGLGLGANRHGVLSGFWGGGYGGDAVSMGNSTNIYTYNHYDNRRRDGGFYGGGGVFYPDDGYSRLYTIRPPGGYDDGQTTYGPTGYAPQTVYRPSQHIFYLHDNNRRATRKSARRDGVD